MYTIVLLEKDDFVILPNGQIRIRHPAYQGRGGYVAFYTYWCPQCQDTKTTWSAIGMVPGKLNLGYQMNMHAKEQMISRAKCIKRYPMLKAVRKDGVVVDHYGNDIAIVDMMCKMAGLNCGFLHRCFNSDKYFVN